MPSCSGVAGVRPARYFYAHARARPLFLSPPPLHAGPRRPRAGCVRAGSGELASSCSSVAGVRPASSFLRARARARFFCQPPPFVPVCGGHGRAVYVPVPANWRRLAPVWRACALRAIFIGARARARFWRSPSPFILVSCGHGRAVDVPVETDRRHLAPVWRACALRVFLTRVPRAVSSHGVHLQNGWRAYREAHVCQARRLPLRGLAT